MSLRIRLEEINNRVVTIKWRQEPSELSGLQEEIAKMQLWIIDYDEVIATKFNTSKWIDLLEKWSKYISWMALKSTSSWCYIEIEDVWAIKVPHQTNLSLHDNFVLLTLFLTAYHTYTLKSYLKTYEQSSTHSEYFDSIICPGIWTGINYHRFIFQTASEEFTINSEELETDDFQKRLKSWYQCITDVSSHLEMFTLINLDMIATSGNKNPFLLDAETNKISLNPDALEIMSATNKVFEAMKNHSDSLTILQEELEYKIQQYTWDTSAYINILNHIETGLKTHYRELNWCPAHKVDLNWKTLFKIMFESSVEIASWYYSYFYNTRWIKKNKNWNKGIVEARGEESEQRFLIAAKMWTLSVRKKSL